MRGIHRRLLAGLLVLFLGAAAGCGAPDTVLEESTPPKTIVVATIFPLADIARNIGGDRVEVITLLPAGASPHTFEPTPRQMEQVAKADVLIQVGAGLDDWARKPAAVVGEGAVQVTVTEGLELRRTIRVDHSDPHRGHSHGHGDPHVWLDPVLVRDEIAPRIFDALCAALAPETEYFAANLVSFQEALTALDAEIKARAAGFKNKSFVSYHSAWGYFADRYGLVEAATVEEAPGKEPSPAWIAAVVELAREHGAGAIFAEPQFSTKAAEVIADEYGGRVLLLDPLGGEGLSGRDTYLDLMRYNVDVLATGLESAE